MGRCMYGRGKGSPGGDSACALAPREITGREPCASVDGTKGLRQDMVESHWDARQGLLQQPSCFLGSQVDRCILRGMCNMPSGCRKKILGLLLILLFTISKEKKSKPTLYRSSASVYIKG